MATGRGKENYDHVLSGPCDDPDCELHNPAVIEDESSRYTACAWFLAGAGKAIQEMAQAGDLLFGDSDDRWTFLGEKEPESVARTVETDLLEDR